MNTEPITVMIADDHAITRGGVRVLLETQTDLRIVAEAATGLDAVRLCAEHAPDVALVDMLMPGFNGVEVTRRVKLVSPRTHVVVLTSYPDDEYLLPAIQAGALSYLLKDISPDDLLTAVRRAATGEATIPMRLAERLMKALQTRSGRSDHFSDLSARELDVLRLIANGHANAEIAQKLFISEKTVKSHVSNVLSKLQLNDRTQAAILAWKEGLMGPGATR